MSSCRRRQPCYGASDIVHRQLCSRSEKGLLFDKVLAHQSAGSSWFGRVHRDTTTTDKVQACSGMEKHVAAIVTSSTTTTTTCDNHGQAPQAQQAATTTTQNTKKKHARCVRRQEPWRSPSGRSSSTFVDVAVIMQRQVGVSRTVEVPQILFIAAFRGHSSCATEMGALGSQQWRLWRR